jgi:hypothetical protein
MGTVTPSVTAETRALRKAYAALNRGDIAAFVEVFDPQIEKIEPAGFPGAGTNRGLAAVRAHLSHHRGNWAEGSCEPERFIVAGDRIVVLVDVKVRLKDEAQWREGRIADVYTFRNGKAIQMRTFVDRAEALEWAGVEALDAGC